MKAATILIILTFLTACGGEEEKEAPVREVSSPHGVILLFDEETRKVSVINTCSFQYEAAGWVKSKYPQGKVVDKGWSSNAYFFMVVELPDNRFKLFFDGTIINEQVDEC